MKGLNKEDIDSAKEMAYLAACAVNGIIPDSGRVARLDPDKLFFMAERHKLTAITAMALESAGIKNEAFTQAKGKAIRKNAVLDLDRAALFERLEAAGIWYLPLKGAVMAGYYPKFGMRQMSDNDILFDAAHADDVKEIMTSIGFTAEHFGEGVHDIYFKKPVSNFEMHRELFNKTHDKKLYDYYRDISLKLIGEDGQFARRLRHEDFYIYLTAHEYKHFSETGTGLRSLLDTYVFWSTFGGQLDTDYIDRELEKLGIRDFEAQNKQLALRLFGGNPLSESEEKLLQYFISCGVYGTLESAAENRIRRHGRMGYLVMRLFSPYRLMVKRYPVLKPLPVLLPVCWLLRLAGGLLHSRRRIMTQIKTALQYKYNEKE